MPYSNNIPPLLYDTFNAYVDARKNKRNTKSQLEFEIELESNLITLYNDLKNRTYKPSPSVCFIVETPVKREIFASQFRDRVVHHLLYNYIAGIFEKQFICDSYSCRKGKGTMYGIERIEHHIRSCSNNYTKEAYILKMDIKGYFMSIDKYRLSEIINTALDKHWKRNTPNNEIPSQSPEFIQFLLQAIIQKDPAKDCIIRGSLKAWDGLHRSKSLTNSPEGIGLPIGDLTSQLFSNIYMGVFDQYVKRELKVKYYGRYVDDFFIIHNSKNYLKELIPQLKCFLQNRLGLNLHPQKTYLQHYSHGVTFLGAFIKPHRKYAANRSVKQFITATRNIKEWCEKEAISPNRANFQREVLNSYCGYFRQFKSKKLVRSQFENSPILNHFVFSHGFSKAKLHSKYICAKYLKLNAEYDLNRILSY